MALYRCHFLDIRDRIEAHEEIDAASLADALIGRMRCWRKDRTTASSRFGLATDGSTAPDEAGLRNRDYGISQTAGLGDNAACQDQSAAMDDTPLDVLAAQINRHFESLGHTGPDYDDHRILVGQLLTAARDGIEIGKWHDWLKAHINRSIRDCQKAMALTHALDPRKELADQRQKNREDVRRYRQRVREPA